MKESPNKFTGWGKNKVEGIVIHFTASQNANGSYNWLMNPDSKASAHVIIDYDGTVMDVVSLANRSFHAGISSWGGASGCNNFMLGIELANCGKVSIDPKTQKYIDAYKKELKYNSVSSTPQGYWQNFPQAQIDSCLALVKDWSQEYKIDPTWIVGHEHVSPGRKIDPGPAFPWHQVTSVLEISKDLNSQKAKLALQSHLERLDYELGTIDGILGKNSKIALTNCFKDRPTLFKLCLNANAITVDSKSNVLEILNSRYLCDHLLMEL